MRTVSSSFSVFVFAALWPMGKSLAANVTESVGRNFSVSLRYPETYANNSKFFCHMSGPGDPRCVHTAMSERGRLALQDDPHDHLLTARISTLTPEDSGLYRWGADVNLLPDFTSEIWITVRSETETQVPTTAQLPEESVASTEPYSRFMMMVALMCVCALSFVCLFGLFQVFKHRNSGSALHQTRTTSNPVPVELRRISLPDLPKFQSDFSLNTNQETDTDYIDVFSAQAQDQIYTDMGNNRLSHMYQSLTADSLHESIYYCIDDQNSD